jgi:hypothetical protein
MSIQNQDLIALRYQTSVFGVSIRSLLAVFLKIDAPSPESEEVVTKPLTTRHNPLLITIVSP